MTADNPTGCPEIGDTVTVQGEVIARNIAYGWMNVRLPSGGVINITTTDTRRPPDPKEQTTP